MTTTDIISNVTKGVGKTEIKVTRTPPKEQPVKVIDLTEKEQPKTFGLPPVEGKIVTEVLPGLTLVRYPSGYTALRVRASGFNGKKTTVGKPLYRAELECLIEALTNEVTHALTYEEAHDLETVPF